MFALALFVGAVVGRRVTERASRASVAAAQTAENRFSASGTQASGSRRTG